MLDNRSTAAAVLRSVFSDTLGIPARRTAAFTDDTPLFGALPELDSMAVATVLTALEDRFGFVIDDDDIDADTFATFGALVAFVERKLAARS